MGKQHNKAEHAKNACKAYIKRKKAVVNTKKKAAAK